MYKNSWYSDCDHTMITVYSTLCSMIGHCMYYKYNGLYSIMKLATLDHDGKQL